jgi:hypothetical protein
MFINYIHLKTQIISSVQRGRWLSCFPKEGNSDNEITMLTVCLCVRVSVVVSSFHFVSHFTDPHETGCGDYAIGGHPNAIILFPTISVNNA